MRPTRNRDGKGRGMRIRKDWKGSTDGAAKGLRRGKGWGELRSFRSECQPGCGRGEIRGAGTSYGSFSLLEPARRSSLGGNFVP